MPKTKTSRIVCLSIFDLKRAGHLIKNSMVTLSWMEWGERKQTTIEVFMNNTDPCITFSCERDGGYFLMQTTSLLTTKCFYGGHRYWFECVCGKRVAILYKIGEQFVCRTCGDLAYPLQQFPHMGRHKTLYRSSQRLNWMSKFGKTRTKFWKGRLTRRQQKRFEKVYDPLATLNRVN